MIYFKIVNKEGLSDNSYCGKTKKNKGGNHGKSGKKIVHLGAHCGGGCIWARVQYGANPGVHVCEGVLLWGKCYALLEKERTDEKGRSKPGDLMAFSSLGSRPGKISSLRRRSFFRARFIKNFFSFCHPGLRAEIQE